jgi:hypothetical protein
MSILVENWRGVCAYMKVAAVAKATRKLMTPLRGVGHVFAWKHDDIPCVVLLRPDGAWTLSHDVDGVAMWVSKLDRPHDLTWDKRGSAGTWKDLSHVVALTNAHASPDLECHEGPDAIPHSIGTYFDETYFSEEGTQE